MGTCSRSGQSRTAERGTWSCCGGWAWSSTYRRGGKKGVRATARVGRACHRCSERGKEPPNFDRTVFETPETLSMGERTAKLRQECFETLEMQDCVAILQLYILHLS